MAVPSRPTSGAPIETTWGDIAHDTAVAQDIQAGNVIIVVSAANNAATVAVTFARPFAAPPFVVVSPSGTGPIVTSAYFGMASSVTASGFACSTQHRAGTNQAASIPTSWIAYGPRA